MNQLISTRMSLWLVKRTALFLGAVAVVLFCFRHQVKSGLTHFQRKLHHFDSSKIVWQKVRPADEGLSAAALERLSGELAEHGTKAFLVVRGNHIAWEWYAPESSPNDLQGTAAMAKAATASVVVSAALSDGRLDLDDPAAKYIPAWRNDPVRSKILIRDLASHASGLDDVDFVAASKRELPSWRQQYYDHPSNRFSVVIHQVPILFPAGSRVKYSGIGYYALAYAVTDSLRDAPDKDIKGFLRHRVMGPLGVPDSDWRLSYGESYNLDGMTLYAFGSGASYTARAAARIGQLVLDQGKWNGREIISEPRLKELLSSCRATVEPSGPGASVPGIPAGGWYLNRNGVLPAVPRDAIFGFGNNDECLLVVPSLDLVVVRLGDALEPGHEDNLQIAHEKVFAPLLKAVVGSSSRRASSEQVVAGSVHP